MLKQGIIIYSAVKHGIKFIKILIMEKIWIKIKVYVQYQTENAKNQE